MANNETVRVRATRAAAGLIGTLVVVVFAGVGQAPAEPSEGDFVGPSPQTMREPAIQAEIAAELKRVDRRAAARREPAAEAKRLRSRTAYKDLSSQEAQALAREFFPQLMLRPAWEAFEPPPGQELVRYYGSRAALLAPEGSDLLQHGPAERPIAHSSDPDDTGSLVNSSLPLRAEDESGRLRAVDPELVDHGSHVEPANAVVEAELPDDLADGIALPEADLTLEPPGAADAAPAEVVGEDKVFWANSDVDTDFFATPTQNGVETFWQLRSVRSPQALSLDVDLPAGASLKSAFAGEGAKVSDSESGSVTVLPPQAIDADGVSVPVKMSVDGNALELSVGHRSGDWRYPIVVDPTVVYDSYTWSWGNTYCPYVTHSFEPGWFWEESPSNSPIFGGCDYSSGVYTQGWGNTTYGTNWFGQWVWRSPPATYIQRAEFWDTDFDKQQWYDTACVYRGIWSTSAYDWQARDMSCDSWFNQNGDYLVGEGGHDNNAAVYQLFYPSDGYRYGYALTRVRGAQFRLSDRNVPVIHSQPPSDQPWVDDTLPGAPQSYSHTVNAADAGMGMKEFILQHPSRSQPGQWAQVNSDRGCSGIWGSSACRSNSGSYQASVAYQNSQLPEGRNEIWVTARDMIGNDAWVNSQGVSYKWHQPIDRTAPTFQTSGSLKQAAQAGQPLSDEYYDLDVNAADGSTTSRATERSGVKSIEILVDGERVDFAANDPQQCPSSCPLDRTWRMYPAAFELGTHVVSVIVKDQVNHAAPTQTFTVNVQDGPEDPTQVLTLCAGAQIQEGDVDELTIAAPPDVVDEIGEQQFGSRYAGSWVDLGTCPPQLAAGIKNWTPVDTAAFYAALTLDGRVDITRVSIVNRSFTTADLEAGALAAGSALDSQGIRSYGAGIDVERQVVIVATQSLTSAQQATVDAVVAPPIDFQLDPNYADPELLDSRTEYPPYLAGKQVVTPRNPGCTSNFTIRRSGVYYGTTAGHCVEVGEAVRIGGTFLFGKDVGRVDQSSNQAGQLKVFADAASYGAIPKQHATRRIYTGGPHEHRTVVKRFDSRGWSKNILLCYVGVASGNKNCGRITTLWPVVIGSTRNNVWGAELKAYHDTVCFKPDDMPNGGDSGSPVYHVRQNGTVKAAGILWGRYDGEACISKIGRMLGGLNAELVMR